MKYAIIIPDGCADEPQASLGDKTPLEAADIPAMDAVVSAGVLGRSNNVPQSLPPGSDVANLSLLGYSILAIAFLIAVGVTSASYVRNAIIRWQREERRNEEEICPRPV